VAVAKVFDRVWDTTTTTGTGTITLANAPPFAYRSFGSVLSTGDTCFYLIAHQLDGSWEVGVGTYNSAGPTLARTTLLASSTGSAINFAAGTMDVMIVDPAGRTFDSTFGVDTSGAIKPYAGLVVPAGYLACDGSAVSRTTYAALFAALSSTQTCTLNSSTTVTVPDTSMLALGMQVTGTGIPASTTIASVVNSTTITLSQAATLTQSSSLVFTAWGKGDGSTTFNVPDMRGRTLIGDGTGSGLTARALGVGAGEETHLLTAAESGLPAHTHPPLSPNTSFAGQASSGTALTASGAVALVAQATTGQNSAASAASAHNNMQPWATVKYIIKT
jgi:microcystin-dependent protein